MEYLIRLVQIHETFRVPEIKSLAVLTGIDIDIIHYQPRSPFCIVRLENDDAAKALISRAILAMEIHELWGSALDYESLHSSVKSNHRYGPQHMNVSWKFSIDCFQGKRSAAIKQQLIDSFEYLNLDGPISMKHPHLSLCIFEDYDLHAPSPRELFLGRFIAASSRDAINIYNLKKRRYISRTSMDAELSLVTANLTLAASGKVFYDPFVGTGSFAVTAAHFGAMSLGSDIDPRSIRGDPGRNLASNFVQYGLQNTFIDSFISDLTNTPLRQAQVLDGIICDPPYGVREGPKVLGYREGKEAREVFIDGVPTHKRLGYIPAKRPYGFLDLLQDVLELAAVMLVDGARLSMWMPTANEDQTELEVPSHPGLDLVSICVQHFNKWSRRLLTYQRKHKWTPSPKDQLESRRRLPGRNANELNPFRRKVCDPIRLFVRIPLDSSTRTVL